MPPIYQNIMNTIQLWISDGKYKVNDKLPSEAMLMKEFKTSRITVTRALNELESKSIIYRQKGRGSFVSTIKSYHSENTDIISLVLPHKINFFSGGQQYAHSIAKYCQENNFLCSVHYSNQLKSNEKNILENLTNYNVSGAIVYPIGNANITALSQLVLKGFPMVLLDRKLDELDLPYVSSDNYAGAYNAVKYMIDKNHKNIGFIGVKDSDVVQARYKGYCRALLDNGIIIKPEIIVTEFNNTQEDEQTFLKKEEADTILKSMIDNRVTALFCVNDLIASMIMKAAHNKKISIPDDISIVGFDHIQFDDVPNLNLTSVAQNFDLIAKETVQLLISKIKNPEKKISNSIIVPTDLFEGNTVKTI
ncbi:MAG: GntR family transcriptional regulator [Spirochaetaceae bacterium]